MKRPCSAKPRRRDGSVLVLALWALLLLSAAVFVWVKFIDQNITLTGERNNGLEAKALAHSGVMVALHPLVTRRTPLLTQRIAADRGFRVTMTGEGGRLNLNWLFTPPQTPDPGKLALFKRYLELRGLNLQQRNRLTDSILDWLAPPGLHTMNGAEDSDDYHPPHRGSFLSVQELARVAGAQPLVSQAGWQEDFTIYTNPGLVDLQSASRLVLESLPNVGEASVDRFLQYRQGPDRVDGTMDDHLFTNVSQALSFLGISGQQAQQLAGYVYVESPLTNVHIVSTGQCGNVYRRVEVVANKLGMQPIILSWKEL